MSRRARSLDFSSVTFNRKIPRTVNHSSVKTMETFDEEKYDCLAEDKFQELVEVGYTHEDLVTENSKRKKVIEMFLQRNTLLKINDIGHKKGNKIYPHVYIFGYEHEGKDNVERILKSDNSDTSSQQFTCELIQGTTTRSEISPEFCRNIGNIKSKVRQTDVPTVFLMVMNCSIHTSDEINERARDKLLGVLGPEVLIRCVLVLTYGKDILREKPLEEHYEEIANGTTWVSRLYKKFYPWLIVVDTNEKSSYGNCCQRNQIEWLLLNRDARFDRPVLPTWRIKLFYFMGGTILAHIIWGLIAIFYSRRCHFVPP